MRFLWDFLKYLVLLVLLLLFGAGCYAGDLAYQELFSEPWDKVLGIENHRNDLASIHQLEAQNGWQKIQVTSTDGTKLTGTYIPMGSKKNGDDSPRFVPEPHHERPLCKDLPKARL